jgi:hypothetical protein
LAFNTAISFITNANWHVYSGEQTMSHFTQMAGLTRAQIPRHRSSHRAQRDRDDRAIRSVLPASATLHVRLIV